MISTNNNHIHLSSEKDFKLLKMKQVILGAEDEYRCKLSKEVQEMARRELQEDGKRRRKALSEVRQWMKSQPHFKKVRLDSNFILRFLRMQKFEVKESCEILDKYLTMRWQHPTWFQNLDCRDPKLAELTEMGYLIALPDRDKHGRRVIYSKAGAFDATRFTTSDMMRAHIMTFETLLNDEENQVRGFTYVLDEKAVTWNQISIWTPSEVSKAFSCCERALPMRHKEIHFMNLPWTMSIIFAFAKSLLSDKIRKRFQTHSGVDSLVKEVDVNILPAEYGGRKNLDECIQLWKNELESNRSTLLELDQMKISGYDTANEQLQVVRKKSRHNSGSGSEVLSVVGNMRKMEISVE